MTKPTPKFCVGEEVAIESKYHPNLNCDRAEVTLAKYSKGRSMGTGEIITTWMYKTSATSPFIWCCESALRKLPPESRTSWEDCVWQPVESKV